MYALLIENADTAACAKLDESLAGDRAGSQARRALAIAAAVAAGAGEIG